MKIVKVTYIAKADYVEKNQNNIKNVMSDLQQLAHPGINYNACLGADGRSFTHIAFFKSDDDQKILFDLPSFKTFQDQLKANGLEAPPKQELISLVGTSTEIFKN